LNPAEIVLKKHFVYFPCMATKTITLELDAYEKLRAAKKAGESFTEVVRRAELTEAPLTGANLLAYIASGGSGVSDSFLDAAEEAGRHAPLVQSDL
jgi:predicted CopG family antitoxin